MVIICPFFHCNWFYHESFQNTPVLYVGISQITDKEISHTICTDSIDLSESSVSPLHNLSYAPPYQKVLFGNFAGK